MDLFDNSKVLIFFSSKTNENIIHLFLVNKAELNDTGKYTCKDRQSGQTTNCDVTVDKAPIRIIKGLPETLIIPQGKPIDCFSYKRVR